MPSAATVDFPVQLLLLPVNVSSRTRNRSMQSSDGVREVEAGRVALEEEGGGVVSPRDNLQ